MNNLVICKACGFILDQSKLGDVCPACGVPAKMFESYVEKISPKRKLLLSMDFHPVMVHFPQAFSFTLFILALLSLTVSGVLRTKLTATLEVVSVLLPVMTVLSIAAGMFDGKIRFRKFTTPLLVRKMVLGVVFLGLTIAGAAYIRLHPEFISRDLYIIATINVVTIGIGARLGLIGVSLLNSKFPG
ncbi:MAG: hypothetical protein JNL74_09805 [Fibrobacteres bacterium]|nr:hypothetical protein [Fibrobacterota bacterium]